MRSFEDQSQHDSLVRMMANYFNTLGYSAIKADIQDYERPDKLYWKGRENEAKIPDLTCYKNDSTKTPIILEAETCSSIDLPHTSEQFQLFRANADQNHGEFHVVVPRICNNRNANEIIAELARQLNIEIDNIWRPST